MTPVSTLRADPGFPLPGELSDTAAAPLDGAVAVFLIRGAWTSPKWFLRWHCRREGDTYSADLLRVDRA